MTNTTNLGLPSFLLGPPAIFGTVLKSTASLPTSGPGRDAVFGSTTASNSTAVSTNFNVSTQETSSFYEGFLKPIDLQVLDYFIRQGYSRELLFWLFTDSVEITVKGGPTMGTRYNPPEDYGCIRGDRRERCFRDFVLVAIAAGVTVEEQTVQTAPPSSAGQTKTAGGGGAAKPETQIFARFCFNPVFADRAKNALGPDLYHRVTTKYADLPPSQFQPKCGDPSWKPALHISEPQPDSFPFRSARSSSRSCRVRPMACLSSSAR